MISIDISAETLISIRAAAKRCPGRPHVATVWRWILNGLNGVKLESVKVGGRRFTSEEALHRFIERTTAAADGQDLPVRSSRQRQIAIAKAEHELFQDGI